MLGELYMEMGNTQEAEKSFREAAAIAKQINAPLELASAYRNLSGVYKIKGQKNKAREYLRQAQEIYGALNHPAYEEIKQEFLESVK
jgi:tetratricopeptide (TPR) repeat protein